MIHKTLYVPLNRHQDFIGNKDLDDTVHDYFTIGKKGRVKYWSIVWHSSSGGATIYPIEDGKYPRWVPNETMITIHFKNL